MSRLVDLLHVLNCDADLMVEEGRSITNKVGSENRGQTTIY